MCEQTEIDYLDGDVVWVKLGACWWPGQVRGFQNLPEDIQREFQKKPLIAAVKFFQEDTYEFVKNYQLIYKYNCTLKDEFIRKGLDKYRSKSKDGSRYMDKFPGDVEMAEKLTGGDPDILNHEKFCPEEKPNISALFGDKKLSKKKRDREDSHRKSDGMDGARKITHPRFVKESDHEVRIRQQPSSLPSTPNNTGSPQYPCHLCNFTSSRVNVIICHIKSHRSGDALPSKSKVKSYTQYRNRYSDGDTPKRKYVRKEKSESSRTKNKSESGKRKQSKQTEKAAKKKKTSDPKIRDTILADWDDESEEDVSLNQSKSSELSPANSTANKSQFDFEKLDQSSEKNNSITDTSEIIAETEKFLKETEKLTSINIIDNCLQGTGDAAKSFKTNAVDQRRVSEKDDRTSDTESNEFVNKPQTEKDSFNDVKGSKFITSDKSDKKSLLSCFDFHEEEPSIPPVRKKSRAFNQKKEIIKEFEMSQALKTEQEKEIENKKVKDDTNLNTSSIDKDLENDEKSAKIVDDYKSSKNETIEEKEQDKSTKISENVKKSNSCETQFEIVEIFEVERVEVGNEKNTKDSEAMDIETSVIETIGLNTKESSEEKEIRVRSNSTKDEQVDFEDERVNENTKCMEHPLTKESEETISGRFIDDTEEETVSESAETLPEQSENSDVDMFDQDQVPNVNVSNVSLKSDQSNLSSLIHKRRGRPKKSFHSGTSGSISGSESPRIKESKSSTKLFEKFEMDRRLSESEGERSQHSGRKRKPNKKYLESDIYVHDLDQKMYRTDDSQSENEEKGSERIKSKLKRNRKSTESEKKSNEDADLRDATEISLNLISKSEHNANSKNVESKDRLSDKTSKQQTSTILECQTSVEAFEKLHALTLQDKTMSKQFETFIFEDKKSSAEEESATKSEDIVIRCEDTKDADNDNTQTKSKHQQADLKSGESINTLQIDSSFDKEPSQQSETSKTVDMLPPKKSQIKKFELSQIDLFNSDAITEKISTDSKSQTARETLEDLNAEMEAENNSEPVDTSKEKENVVSKKVEVDIAAVTSKIETQKSKNLEDEEESMSVDQIGQEVEINILEDQNCKSENNEAQKKSIGPTKHKLKSTSEFGTKSKKDKELFPDESANTFQEAFLKTLDMDKKKDEVDESDSLGKGKKSKKIEKKKSEESENVDVSTGISQTSSVTKEKSDISNFPKSIQDNSPDVVATANVKSMETDDKDHKIDGKIENTVVQDLDQLGSSSSESNIASKSFGQSSTSEDVSKPLDIDVQKVDESSRMSTSTLSPSSDVGVPVKKREMPRIIENVTLTEPMQILKSKLLDKLPPKGVKHKLDAMSAKKGDPKSSAKPKVMKIESLSLNTKMKTGSKVTSPHLSLTKKLQVLKAEEAETAAMIEAQNEQINVKTSKTQSTTSTSEKYIQQSSQSLADMELDINSMPFVLSEDVLTPENIEQMPVVITSIIPTSSTVSATLSLTPTTQMVSSTQTQFKLNENTNEVSPTKKKSGTPAILKNKAKAKPTITSIKTIVPPLTGGVKGIKFQSAPATSKVQPLLAQKGTSGKYVVVQTSGGQQLRYSVQGKGIQQKIAVPTGKSTGTAQVVQQGGKVVILTSAQASQSKVLPMNISKTLTGKVQRIMTSKGQVFCPISPQGIINSKTVIAPKGDGVSPTTSKLPAGHKIINTQGIIASKGVLTPISGAIGKTALLSTLSQGILTKGGIYTPISASTLSGKTIIGSKALVTKGATILSSQNLGSSKAILTPISQAVAGKTILGSPGIVSTKATVLTPITGQQVKAIAAKSPSKGTKVQYQSVQQKVQLPMVQKSQKATATSQGRSGQLKTASSAVVLQNTIPTQKSLQQGKKIAKQTIVQGSSLQTLTPQGTMQQTVGVNTHGQQKGKVMSSSTIQKVIIPRGNRHTKTQQKIVVQKVQEHSTSAPNIQTKQSVAASTVANVPKAVVQQKPTAGTPATTKTHTKGQTINKSTTQQQKNLSNVTMNSASASNLNTNLSTSLPLAPQERIEADKKSKIENILEEPVPKEQPKLEKFNAEKGGEVEKVEEPKIATQPQIMALPTESSDGTQTYVLVTIDEQGQIQPLDNNTLMSLEGTTQNPDGTRTLYIDPSSLGEAGTLDNIVLQFDNGALPSIQTTATEPTQTIISESFPATDVIQSSNQDILAAALANTGFQQEISLADNAAGNVVTTGLTQTSLINQTILQSTIIPPTEPISSPSVLETSLTLNQPIMTPLEVPSNLPMPSESPSTSTVATIPSSLELPITITNPNISYISTGEAQIQIPGNSMPDIGEIMETPSSAEIAQTEMPASTQYLVLPNLEENITVDSQNVQSTTISMPTVSYSVSIPNNMVLQSSQVQTTPSMPIIDDTYAENVQFPTTVEQSIATEASFVDVPVSEMLISKSVSRETEKSQDVTVTSEMIVSTEDSTPQESIVSTNEYSGSKVEEDAVMSLEESYSSQEESAKPDEVTLKPTIGKDNSNSNVVTEKENEDLSKNDNIVHMKIAEQPDDPMTSNMHVMDENNLVSSESTVKMSPVQDASFEVSDSNEVDENVSQESKNIEKLKELNFNEESNSKVHSPASEVQASTSNEVEVAQDSTEVLPAADTLDRMDEQSMDMDETVESKESKSRFSCLEDNQGDEPSSQAESDSVQRNMELNFDESNTENSQETPSQSYEQFNIAVTTDSTDTPSQSATKSENSREPTQSITYEPMETDEEVITTEPPTQSFEHSKMNEASQSYEVCAEANTNAPTQSFNELMQSQEERVIDETIDDQTFPTQSYEIDKTESIPETLETDAEISQEGNMPSQSNDIGTDGIGTSSVSTNNSGLNEDETASSSYVPETPENQERDPDQESAISTSSCEIPPCAELNIASSSAEHTSIHDNGVPEIPTSSYNLNPDITSTHVDSVPTSSYEEQNVSTSYEVPISMPGLEETPSQNFVTESTDHRNEPSSYYAHHQEVTPSYYESVEEETNPRLNEDTQGEVTPSYYDGTTQEASQSYFNPEEATPSYSSHSVSPSYYKHRPETEASQSYYSTDDIDKSEEQSSSQNIEASQSFYQEQPDEIKLTQQGEATPTYTERYPVDYTLDNSPIERHDLVESSVPATRPTER